MDLASVPREVLVVALAGAIAIALLQAVVSALGRWRRRRRVTLRFERASRGEVAARALLERHGFTVVGAQVAGEHRVRVDDEEVTIALRADYLVTRGSARYVAEVKTGALAPRIETSATRRQMLEYRIAFDVDGVLLVDAETDRVHAVTFPALSGAPPGTSWGLVAAALLVTVAVVAVAFLRFG